jgi:hypothetical protein
MHGRFSRTVSSSIEYCCCVVADVVAAAVESCVGVAAA